MASKHKPPVLVDMSLLIVEITNNYVGNKGKFLEIGDILKECICEEEFYFDGRQSFCGCCSIKKRF